MTDAELSPDQFDVLRAMQEIGETASGTDITMSAFCSNTEENMTRTSLALFGLQMKGLCRGTVTGVHWSVWSLADKMRWTMWSLTDAGREAING